MIPLNHETQTWGDMSQQEGWNIQITRALRRDMTMALELQEKVMEDLKLWAL